MYRKRTRGSKKFNEAMARARAAKERLRLDGPAPEYPPDLPLIRRRVIIVARSGRIDSYDVSADGVSLGRMGWALALVFVRKAFIRTGRFG
jgi:hypothetical protein